MAESLSWHEEAPDDALRREALDAQRRHDPVNQGTDFWPNRCAICHYTHHPCETYDLATTVLMLLDRGRSR